MGTSLLERIWNDVFDQVGEDLRVVTRYTGREFETKMRDDVRAQYTTDEDQVVVDDTIIKQLSLSDTDNAFKTGQLNGLVRVFDEAWVLSWPDYLEGKSGVIISIQRNGTNATMDDIDWCIEYLEREIADIG